MMPPGSAAAFRLSRVHAQGWNAARTAPDNRVNPYPADPERARWQAGFNEAQTDTRIKAI